ncbi:Trans-enoyl reductase, partial [Lachnellula suecica]
IVIKVIVSGTNPKDWKYPFWKDIAQNSGDDIAGTVHAVGKDVYEFALGDRVAALHVANTANGSFAEYAVAPDWTTFHIPHNVSFEEAATVPTAALTAAMALYGDMKLPPPYSLVGSGGRVPILIYGVTSAVGAFAAKFARLSGLGPVIGVAGRAGEFAKTLVDYVVDYREGEDALVAAVEATLAKEGLGTKRNGSLEATLRILDPNGGTVSTVLPPKLFAKAKENYEYPPTVKSFNSAVVFIHLTHKDFGSVWTRYLGRLLGDGRLKAHPYEVVPGGLNGVLTGLQKLKEGNTKAVKYVYRIEETGNILVTGDANTLGPDGIRISSRPNNNPLRNFPFPAEH